MRKLSTVLVVGVGLIGTSIALALRGHGVTVALSDVDEDAVRLARELGAGQPWRGEPADLGVLAVPPDLIAEVLADLQKRGAARAYTDVASVKAEPTAAAARLGCDLTTFVPGHPLAGRERSGPAAARADLFLGRPWALCPGPETSAEPVRLARELIALCGGKEIDVGAREHDEAVALVSHAPHVVSAAVAAALEGAGGQEPDHPRERSVAMELAGQGLRDVTRIAGGDVRLWRAILAGNALPVAEAVDAIAQDLTLAAVALRIGDLDAITDLLQRGISGRGRIPGKHGGPARDYAVLQVVLQDRPGELGRLFNASGLADVNIEDVRLEHSPGLPVAVAEISVRPQDSERLTDALRFHGWHVSALWPGRCDLVVTDAGAG
ncbi:Arogenate dehydrogenase [[Actinomadura] parvosata subsp. kistnae]|uniref:Prephenate dehydrogenase n=1 Tax=[Actinomadura] parvosata subsp. kistnae TaxID=1909395 RepID=A0A1V0AG89_9ACTN|nr:prephenate dehydrogenase [Nonomuraea sp. ATCC 55076]AQZ69220.1 prephenate dehydrogenase [Nonomuraea sp. ATCC 55076]SPL92168.1 Arogenate dehydrogenase [Actinomadura parvosata subsp. kistnae]